MKQNCKTLCKGLAKPCARPSVFSAFARVGLAIVVATVFSCVPAAAETFLATADLQYLNGVGQITQAGWQAGEIAALATSSEPIPLTASGSAAGITATMVTVGSWNARGGTTQDRGFVVGTSFDGVVSDLWFNREMSFTLQLMGLLTGSSYQVRAWHNDPYLLNAGAAAGGGTVQASVTGATLSSRTNGTITNLSGTQTDSAFGITRIAFVPTSSTAVVTFTRSGGSFQGVPLSGLEITTDAIVVPEPATGATALVGLVCSGYAACRRRRSAAAVRHR